MVMSNDGVEVVNSGQERGFSLRTDGGNVSIPPVFVDMPNGTVTSDGLNSPEGIRGRAVCDIWDIVRHGWKENGIEGETQEEDDDEPSPYAADTESSSYASTALWMPPTIPDLQ